MSKYAYFRKILNIFKKPLLKNDKNHLFTLWISDNNELPELQYLSLKSMLLTGHEVTLYTYSDLNNVPKGIKVEDANKILDKSKIFTYKDGFNKGSYSGFANWFRVKCLYEKGLTWFDCDIIAINNINDIANDNFIIASEYDPKKNIYPTNGVLRLKKRDVLLKEMLIHMERVEDNISHGETGPRLLKYLLDNKFSDYSIYLKNPNFMASINYYDYKNFLKPSNEIVPLLNFEEIWGFHIWNAMFREHGNGHEKADNGFYYDLKMAILKSFNKEEYEKRIEEIKKFNISSKN
jgi:hypothetical protein